MSSIGQPRVFQDRAALTTAFKARVQESAAADPIANAKTDFLDKLASGDYRVEHMTQDEANTAVDQIASDELTAAQEPGLGAVSAETGAAQTSH